MTYYYADSQNQTHGPCTREELEQLARRGILTGRSRVIEHGGQTWSTWEAIEASFAPKPAAAPAPILARAPAPTLTPASPAPTPAADLYPVNASREPIQIGAVLFGLLLVLIQYLIFPYTLLMQALRDLSLWGRRNALPTTQSDTPVLTFVTIVLRPPAHLIITFLFVVSSLLGFLSTLSQVFFDRSGQNRFVLLIDSFGVLLGGFVLAYFINVFIALFYELAAFLILIANNIRRIAEKD